MDPPQEQLYGDFPRSVGSPEQHLVHSPEEFDLFVESVEGERNVYASLSWFPHDGPAVCDKVSFDFDTDAKTEAFEDGLRDDQKIRRMKLDSGLAEEVLGDVCEDVRKLAEVCMVEDIPSLGVFSGFGVHVHQFYEPESNPAEKMGSTARYWREELGLETLDAAPIGDEQRIMRVPNCRRVHVDYEERTDDYGVSYLVPKSSTPCDLWTVPLTVRELYDVTPERLLALSGGPRHVTDVTADERPPMPLYEDHTRDGGAVTMRPDGPSFEGDIGEEGIEWLLPELLPMPCIHENLLLDPEPPHKIRVNAAVMLFNVGLQPPDVLNLFEAVGWNDFDRAVTAQHLKHIYEHGYSDMNCRTLQTEGYCTRTDDPHGCPTFGWSGGEREW